MSRLAQQPGERIDRSQPVSFTFDGKPAAGFAGDTIVSALYAGGRRVFSRSFKYHRPRGELCGCGQCANSLFQIEGAPGIRGCSEPIREGLRVVHQNAWPSLDFDVMRATDRVGGPFTPVGFYYKTFIRPRRLWPVYEKVLRSAAGLGRLPRRQDEREWETEYRRRRCDVLVIGGGAAGLAAATRAAELGADVVLCDEDAVLGGLLGIEGGHERVRELEGRARDAGVEILSGAPALGFFDGLVPVWQGSTLHQVRADQHVVATGAIQQPLVFADNDLPGVMLSGGARRLAAAYAVKPGERAVVATVDDRGLDDALALSAVGLDVVVADLRPDAGGGELAGRIRAAGITLLTGHTVVRAQGRDRVERAVVAKVDARGRALGDGSTHDCDLIAVSGGSAGALSLLLQAGGRAIYRPEIAGFAVTELPAGLHAAGAAAGHDRAEAVEVSGAIAGAEAAAALGRSPNGVADARERLAQLPAAAPVATPPAQASDGGRRGKAFVDLDEDVTVKDIKRATLEGYDSLELSKRYTTVTMGPSQGRFSQLPAARVLAAETGLDLGTVGLTTARPPWSTVPMGVLAGRPLEAAKRSAVHRRHEELGATVRWAGDWRRAYDYGDPVGESVAVQAAAGIIDVSTLGKLLVRGPDAGELLDRLYPNRMSNLAPDRIRYGVTTSEAGRITDDGTVCRIDDETFYVTTTSAGVAGVEQSFTWWLETWGLNAHITDLTQGVAAMNLAGPQARGVLTGLTDLDCSAEAFKYLDARHAEIAGVPCMLLRIGFVGELGYEIHCPSVNAEHVWDAIVRAGSKVGLRPFGLEPQRVLRLQKLHVIVGQDTDSEMTPYGAGMDWIVKLDKQQDFIGRWALEHTAAHEPSVRLVGFTTPGGELPTEGAVVLGTDGAPEGQVTSARRSPRLGQVIGLATVPAALAGDGAQIWISDAGRRIAATVTTKPFYDPEGEVLRS
ncbi:MAG: aminomethyltransferase [Solirubrobacterales bacterium]|nr:aminomethyltransferase [Solirubrobacterales bacterium]